MTRGSSNITNCVFWLFFFFNFRDGVKLWMLYIELSGLVQHIPHWNGKLLEYTSGDLGDQFNSISPSLSAMADLLMVSAN